MLVARRDPFHSGAHDASNAQVPGGGTARLARTVGMLQVAGSLLAIPIGLASAYSIYRANFSVETTCQGLRSDIISMIGKSIDAGTRRMLVRRDVEKFEQSCGAIEADATAAFKALLAKDKPAIAAVAPVATPAAPIPAAPATDVVRKAEPRLQTAAKMPAAAWPGAERVHRDPDVSDTQWLAAVRQALVMHEPNQGAAEAVEAPAAPPAPPALRPALHEADVPVRAPTVAAPALVQLAPAVAPALPPAAAVPKPGAAVAVAPAPRTDVDHPVPPAAIPDPAVAVAAAPEERDHPRIRRLIAKIPLMGNVINKAW